MCMCLHWFHQLDLSNVRISAILMVGNDGNLKQESFDWPVKKEFIII